MSTIEIENADWETQAEVIRDISTFVQIHEQWEKALEQVTETLFRVGLSTRTIFRSYKKVVMRIMVQGLSADEQQIWKLCESLKQKHECTKEEKDLKMKRQTIYRKLTRYYFKLETEMFGVVTLLTDTEKGFVIQILKIQFSFTTIFL